MNTEKARDRLDFALFLIKYYTIDVWVGLAYFVWDWAHGDEPRG